jgi:hypothetical protein
VATWYGKPNEINPLICAQHGFVNTGSNIIACCDCGKTLSFTSTNIEVQKQIVPNFLKNLGEHKEGCIFSGNTSPYEFVNPFLTTSGKTEEDQNKLLHIAEFKQRLASYASLSEPHIPGDFLEECEFIGELDKLCLQYNNKKSDESPKVIIALYNWSYESQNNRDLYCCRICQAKRPVTFSDDFHPSKEHRWWCPVVSKVVTTPGHAYILNCMLNPPKFKDMHEQVSMAKNLIPKTPKRLPDSLEFLAEKEREADLENKIINSRKRIEIRTLAKKREMENSLLIESTPETPKVTPSVNVNIPTEIARELFTSKDTFAFGANETPNTFSFDSGFNLTQSSNVQSFSQPTTGGFSFSEEAPVAPIEKAEFLPQNKPFFTLEANPFPFEGMKPTGEEPHKEVNFTFNKSDAKIDFEFESKSEEEDVFSDEEEFVPDTSVPSFAFGGNDSKVDFKFDKPKEEVANEDDTVFSDEEEEEEEDDDDLQVTGVNMVEKPISQPPQPLEKDKPTFAFGQGGNFNFGPQTDDSEEEEEEEEDDLEDDIIESEGEFEDDEGEFEDDQGEFEEDQDESSQSRPTNEITTTSENPFEKQETVTYEVPFQMQQSEGVRTELNKDENLGFGFGHGSAFGEKDTFGQSSFGSSEPVFGESTFGQTTFGQTSFGTSSFGTVPEEKKEDKPAFGFPTQDVGEKKEQEKPAFGFPTPQVVEQVVEPVKETEFSFSTTTEPPFNFESFSTKEVREVKPQEIPQQTTQLTGEFKFNGDTKIAFGFDKNSDDDSDVFSDEEEEKTPDTTIPAFSFGNTESVKFEFPTEKVEEDDTIWSDDEPSPKKVWKEDSPRREYQEPLPKTDEKVQSPPRDYRDEYNDDDDVLEAPIRKESDDEQDQTPFTFSNLPPIPSFGSENPFQRGPEQNVTPFTLETTTQEPTEKPRQQLIPQPSSPDMIETKEAPRAPSPDLSIDDTEDAVDEEEKETQSITQEFKQPPNVVVPTPEWKSETPRRSTRKATVTPMFSSEKIVPQPVEKTMPKIMPKIGTEQLEPRILDLNQTPSKVEPKILELKQTPNRKASGSPPPTGWNTLETPTRPSTQMKWTNWENKEKRSQSVVPMEKKSRSLRPKEVQVNLDESIEEDEEEEEEEDSSEDDEEKIAAKKRKVERLQNLNLLKGRKSKEDSSTRKKSVPIDYDFKVTSSAKKSGTIRNLLKAPDEEFTLNPIKSTSTPQRITRSKSKEEETPKSKRSRDRE